MAVVKSKDSRASLPGCEFWLHSLLTLYPWSSNSTSLCLNFLILRMGATSHTPRYLSGSHESIIVNAWNRTGTQ